MTDGPVVISLTQQVQFSQQSSTLSFDFLFERGLPDTGGRSFTIPGAFQASCIDGLDENFDLLLIGSNMYGNYHPPNPDPLVDLPLVPGFYSFYVNVRQLRAGMERFGLICGMRMMGIILKCFSIMSK